jgi:hypothetical protein
VSDHLLSARDILQEALEGCLGNVRVLGSDSTDTSAWIDAIIAGDLYRVEIHPARVTRSHADSLP